MLNTRVLVGSNALVWLALVVAVAASAAVPTPAYPAQTQLSFYNASFPYGARLTLKWDYEAVFQFATSQPTVRAVFQPVMTAFGVMDGLPYATNGVCDSVVTDAGDIVTAFDAYGDTDCGNLVFRCANPDAFETQTLKRSECPTCSNKTYGELVFMFDNIDYLICGYPTLLVSSDTPIVIKPQYAYAAWVPQPTTATAASPTWEQSFYAVKTNVSNTLPQTTVTFSGASQVLSAFVPSDGSVSTAAPLTTGPTTANASVCTLPDPGLFITSNVEVGETINGYNVDCDIPIYFQSTMVQAFHLYCSAEATCSGYTTFVDPVSGLETLGCMLMKASVSNDVPVSFRRMSHIKATDAQGFINKCATTTSFSGMLDIAIESTQDNSFTMSSYLVFVDGIQVATCTTWAFTCDSYDLCTTVQVYPGSVVEVLNTIQSASQLCGHAARIVFSLSSIDAVAGTPRVPVLAPAEIRAAIAQDFVAERYVQFTSQPTRALFFVSNVAEVVVTVVQSGFECNRSDAKASCAQQPAITANFYGEDATYSCGGSLPFASNAEGYSGQCLMNLLCTNTTLTKLDPTTTGYLQIGGNFSSALAKAAGTDCPVVGMLVRAKLANASLPGGFVFTATPRSMYYQTHFYDTDLTRTASDFARAAFPLSSAPPNLTAIPDIIGFKDSNVYSINWNGVNRKEMSIAATQTCIIDQLSDTYGYCRFLIPPNASNFVLHAEDHNLKQDSIWLYIQGTTTVGAFDPPGVKFGGSGKSPFITTNATASLGNCRTFIPVYNSSLKDKKGKYNYQWIVLGIPSSFASKQLCFHNLVFRMTFTGNTTNTTISSSVSTVDSQQRDACSAKGGLFCFPLSTAISVSKTTGVCLSYESLCNGITDCTFSEDESNCGRFSLLESGYQLNSSMIATMEYSEASRSACDVRAVSRLSSFYAFNGTYCIIYDNSSYVSYITSPLKYIVAQPSYAVYGALWSRLHYGHCTDSFTCNSRGVAQPSASSTGGIVRCVCSCAAGFSGSDCSQVDSLALTTSVQVLFVFRNSTNSSIRVPEMTAKSLGSELLILLFSLYPDGNLVCDNLPVQMDSSGLMSMICTSPIAHNYLSVNLTAVSFHSYHISVVRVVPLTLPSFESISGCSKTNSSSLSCGLVDTGKPLAAIKVGVNTLVSNSNIRVQAFVVDTSISARRLGNSAPYATQLDCVPYRVASPPCVTTSCMVNLANSALNVINFSVSVVDSSNATLNASDMCDDVSVIVRRRLAFPSVVVPSMIQHVEGDYKGFLAGGIILAVAGLIFALLGACLFRSNQATVHELTEEVKADTSLSRLHRLLKTIMIEMGYYERPDVFARKERWSLSFGIFAMNLFVAAVFLLLYFKTSSSYTNNTSIVVERYLDSNCESSAATPIPYAAYIIPETTSRTCEKREQAGSNDRTFFASGECTRNAQGKVVALVRSHQNLLDCVGSGLIEIEPNACIPAVALWGFVRNDVTYAVLRCGTIESVRARFDSFSPSSVIQPVFSELLPQTQNNETFLQRDSVNGVFVSVGKYASLPLTTTSTAPNRVATLAKLPTDDQLYMIKMRAYCAFNGLADMRCFSPATTPRYSLVLQVADEVYADPESIITNTSTAIDTRVDNVRMKDMGPYIAQNVTPLAPLNGDVPVGKSFNLFGTTLENTGINALAMAEVYYSIVGTIVDIGSWFDFGRANNGDGFTIHFNLKASKASQGVIFAVGDAWEDYSQTSPLLARLVSMITSNKPESSWFNETFSVYSSLYIDAPSEQLVFFAASPAFDFTGKQIYPAPRVTRLAWDLNELGIRRLLNGVWHQVAIVFKKVNGQHLAQLMVDGESSQSIAGWNKCIPRGIDPISAFPVKAQLKLSANSQVMRPGGALWLGAFNGGLNSLEFVDHAMSEFDLWRNSFSVVRNDMRINRSGFLAVGWVLCVAAIIMFALTIATSLREVIEVKMVSQANDEHIAFFSYAAVVGNPLIDPSSKVRYEVISCSAAMRWLNLTHAQLTPFLEELSSTSDDVRLELVRLLHLARLAEKNQTANDKNLSPPSATDWNELVQWDRQEQARVQEAYDSAWIKWFATAPDQEDPFDMSQFSFLEGGLDVEAEQPAEGAVVSLSAGGVPIAHTATEEPANAPSKEIIDAVTGKAGKDDEKNRKDVGRIGSTRISRVQAGHSSSQNARGASKQSQVDRFADPDLAISMGIASLVQWSFNASVDLYQMLQPVIQAVQVVFIWMNTMQLSGVYDSFFRPLFSFVSIDWIISFGHLPNYFTPLMQLFFGFFILSLILYHASLDEYTFSWYVARYTLKRDQVDNGEYFGEAAEEDRRRQEELGQSMSGSFAEDLSLSASESGDITPSASGASSQSGTTSRRLHRFNKRKKTQSLFSRIIKKIRVFIKSFDDKKKVPLPHTKELMENIEYPFGRIVEEPVETTVALLPFRVCVAIDAFLALRPPVTDEEKSLVELHESDDGVKLECKDHEGTTYLLSAARDIRERDPMSRHKFVEVINNSNGELMKGLQTVGIRCPDHPDRRLVPQIQTDVWPFVHAPSCCVVNKGVRCGVNRGVVFHCGHTWFDENGTVRQCEFALCERHNRGGFWNNLYGEVVGLFRLAYSRGLHWIVAIIVLILANSLYTPILKTALMILACHPMYQCDFGNCWKDPTQAYTVAVYLCIAIVFLFGLGLPLMQMLQLRRRKQLLGEVFFADEYQNRYNDVESSASGDTLSAVGPTGESGNVLSGPQSGEAVAATVAAPSNMQSIRTRVLKAKEWARFLASDPTMLGSLYRTLKFDWLYLSPLLLVWKVALLVPAVFIPVGTLGQAIGIAVVEICFAIFIFGTKPFISPMVDLMYCVGAVHQMLLFGVQCLDVVKRYDTATANYSTIMIGISLGYLCFSLVCILWTVVGPQWSKWYNRRKTTKALADLGVQYSMSVSLYLVPQPEEKPDNEQGDEDVHETAHGTLQPAASIAQVESVVTNEHQNNVEMNPM